MSGDKSVMLLTRSSTERAQSDARTDIYGLEIMMNVMLTGSRHCEM
ncbi:MAG: hypothetical protein ACLUUG_12720 [Lachnospiraceae bacterium]